MLYIKGIILFKKKGFEAFIASTEPSLNIINLTIVKAVNIAYFIFYYA